MSGRQQAKQTKLTLAHLKEMLDALKERVDRQQQAPSPFWWRDHAGRFENDPLFDEIVRLGRQERLRYDARRRRAKRARP